MRPNDLLRLLQAVPFRPFRVIMNDGTIYDVRHQELVDVGRSSWVYMYVPTPTGTAERYDVLSYLLINRIEVSIPLPTSSNGG
jgi:hypothetical protein